MATRLLTAQHEQAEGPLWVEADRLGQRQPLLTRPARADEVADEAVARRLPGVGGLALEEQDESRDDAGALDGALVGVAQGESADVDRAESLARGRDGHGIHAVTFDETSGAQAREGIEAGERVRATPRVLGGRARSTVPLAVLVDEDGPPTEQLVQRVGDVVDPATAEHERGETVVRRRCLLDAFGVLPDRLVRIRERGEGVLGVGQRARLDERHGGQRGEVAEQADLLARERARRAVGGEEDTDEVRLDDQRCAADRDDALLADGAVDRLGVPEALVGPVVGGPVRLVRRGDEATESGAQGEAHRLEGRRHRAVGGAHVGVAGVGVVEGEVGEVGADEPAGPAHDRVEDRTGVALGGQLAGRVEQGGEAGLTVLVHLAGARDAQGEVPGLGRRVGGGDLGDRRVGGEQLQQVQDLLGMHGRGRRVGGRRRLAAGGHGQILGASRWWAGRQSVSGEWCRRWRADAQ